MYISYYQANTRTDYNNIQTMKHIAFWLFAAIILSSEHLYVCLHIYIYYTYTLTPQKPFKMKVSSPKTMACN